MAVPSAALICSNVSKPLFQNSNKRASNLADLFMLRHNSRHNELLEACSCLTLAGPCSPTPMGMWWEPNEWIPYSLWYFGGSSNQSFDLINNTNHIMIENDKDRIKIIHHEYSELDVEI